MQVYPYNRDWSIMTLWVCNCTDAGIYTVWYVIINLYVACRWFKKLSQFLIIKAIPNQLHVSRTDQAEIVTRVAGKKINKWISLNYKYIYTHKNKLFDRDGFRQWCNISHDLSVSFSPVRWLLTVSSLALTITMAQEADGTRSSKQCQWIMHNAHHACMPPIKDTPTNL